MNKKKKMAKGKLLPSFKEFLNMLVTFSMVMFVFVIFRSETVADAFQYYKGIFSTSNFEITSFENRFMKGEAFVTLFLLLILLIIEWRGKDEQYAIQHWGRKYPQFVRFLFYALLLFLIGVYAPTTEMPFIYLQF